MIPYVFYPLQFRSKDNDRTRSGKEVLRLVVTDMVPTVPHLNREVYTFHTSSRTSSPTSAPTSSPTSSPTSGPRWTHSGPTSGPTSRKASSNKERKKEKPDIDPFRVRGENIHVDSSYVVVREETRNALSLEPFSLMKLVGLNTLMRVLTVLKTRLVVFPQAMVRAEAYHTTQCI
jgi:hypothetical protein